MAAAGLGAIALGRWAAGLADMAANSLDNAARDECRAALAVIASGRRGADPKGCNHANGPMLHLRGPELVALTRARAAAAAALGFGPLDSPTPAARRTGFIPAVAPAEIIITAIDPPRRRETDERIERSQQR
jgi:hypothetical protein